MQLYKHQDTLEKIRIRVHDTLRQVGNSFPHFADPNTGKWVTTENGDWTGGFLPGMLWLLHTLTGEEMYRIEARKYAKILEKRITDDTVYRGFLFYYSAALGSILSKDREMKEMGLKAAEELSKSYNEKVKVFPIGVQAEETIVGRTEVTIDTMMCLPLLWWAWKETGDKKYYEYSVEHSKTLVRFCVRNDGSIAQSVSFDVETGKILKTYTHKGYSPDSCWARGQAWGIHGYAFAYMMTGLEEFLQVAMKAADYYVRKIPKDLIPFYDFDDPRIPNVERDTSTATVTTSALLKLSKKVPQQKRQTYLDVVVRTWETLIGHYLTPTSTGDKRPTGILAQGCYNRNIDLATNNELIWGDYYLLETLFLAEKDIVI